VGHIHVLARWGGKQQNWFLKSSLLCCCTWPALKELLGYISQFGTSNLAKQKVQHFFISKYRYHKCRERR
jgi:hypothetical protein